MNGQILQNKAVHEISTGLTVLCHFIVHTTLYNGGRIGHVIFSVTISVIREQSSSWWARKANISPTLKHTWHEHTHADTHACTEDDKQVPALTARQIQNVGLNTQTKASKKCHFALHAKTISVKYLSGYIRHSQRGVGE